MPRQIVFTGHVTVASGAKGEREDARVAIAQTAQYGITGLTLLSDGNFISALEGPPEPLESILTYYQLDTRLGGVKALLDETREARDFPDYQIGFRRGDFVLGMDQTFRLYGPELKKMIGRAQDGEAKILLRTFARINNILT